MSTWSREMEEGNKTCARLEVHEGLHDSTVKKTLFVKSTWEPTKAFPTSFSLAVTDGCQAWTFEGDFSLPSAVYLSFLYRTPT